MENKFTSPSVYNCDEVTYLRPPDHSNFKITKHYEKSSYLLVQVNYPDENYIYNGNKILLYSGISIEKLKQEKILEPYFTYSDNKLPIAMFEPSDLGWIMGEVLIKKLTENVWRRIKIKN